MPKPWHGPSSRTYPPPPEPTPSLDAEKRYERRMSVAGVPERHRQFDIETACGLWRKVFEHIDGNRRRGFSIALVGDRGTGKTQLAVEIIRKVCRERGLAKYTTAAEFFRALRATYSTPERSERDVFTSHLTPVLLVIDEMQVRGESAWEEQTITDLIDRRYRDMTDTLLLANLSHDGFRESVGPNVYDRIIECGGVIECEWESFRA